MDTKKLSYINIVIIALMIITVRFIPVSFSVYYGVEYNMLFANWNPSLRMIFQRAFYFLSILSIFFNVKKDFKHAFFCSFFCSLEILLNLVAEPLTGYTPDWGFFIILAELIGVVGGLIVSHYSIGLHPARYIHSVWLWLNTKDIYISLLKAFIFGTLISLVCATQGYETNGGAKDVGISTTKAAVKSTVYMLFADFIINIIFYL